MRRPLPGSLGILWGGAYGSGIKSSGLMNLTWSLCPLLAEVPVQYLWPGQQSLHVWAWKGPFEPWAFHIKLALQPHPRALLRGA